MHGPGVLVTRPAGQARALGDALRAAGFTPLCLPTLSIEPIDPAAALAALRAALPCDLAIFISANAVQHALPVIAAADGLPAGCRRVAAVGPASARALQAAGFSNVLMPAARFDSEGLLALPQLQHVAGRRVMIFRGHGGRTLLADTLAARGADVRAVACYRRVAAGDPAQLTAWLKQGAIAALTAASRASLDSLLELAGPAAAQLKTLPLVVLSAALADYARHAGFSGPLMSAIEASDAGLVAAVRVLLGPPTQPR